MNNTVKLYTLPLNDIKAYLFVGIFVLGNLLFPQLAHLVPQGGLILLPIYFFTLIAAYKYGIHVGVLTAVLSPVINSLLFGMPPVAALPSILIKSILLAVSAALLAKKYGNVSIVAILFAVFIYQLAGSALEWILTKDFSLAIQDIKIGVPGIILQIVAGYFILKMLEKV
ncbi:MAG: ECF transporter S component [Paludibacteraceae bacterium]